MSQGFVVNVASQLEANQVEEIADEDPPPGSYITHLYPSDCPNIMSAMKALITGFVNHPPDGQDSEAYSCNIGHSLTERCAPSKTKTPNVAG